MNINALNKFEVLLKKYQFIYGFLIIIITIFLVLGLLFFKNVVAYDFKGILSEEILEFSNLNFNDMNLILNSKKIVIEKEKIKFEIIDILELENNYSIKIKINLPKKYLINNNLKVKFILEEESLYQFILDNMKGEM